MNAAPMSTLDLTDRVLTMAKTGVYRQSVFEALGPIATRRQIRDAIAQAKQFGLYTVSALRDEDLGTYYQVEAANYESFQAASKALAAGAPPENLATQIVVTHAALQAMLTTVAGSTLGLGLLGGWCLIDGHTQLGRGLWLGAVVAGGLWGVQRWIARRVLG
ncbi:hypothetical protein VB780_16810 [Leptolyngbya sp. CCNP1308]|uniref:hypothetical protein n=1 Tax=Leptolyngbya sp. CCNP1308 TaxID=3110255 RepID=UPI002B1F19C0|nr:hypothetical protein [Leptolyngbya sp. CCNP1308]MEA5450244.1 hypothetical protein [Leptolyngbya sp. CCNP1308]